MAIYHLNASTGSRSGGQSAAAKSDYIARAGRYSKDRGEVALVESANMPEWVRAGRGRAAGAALDYWRQADQAERSNGVLFRQVEFALPVELPPAERQALARQFADELATVPGGKLPYTLAVHEKAGNPHAHLVMSERINDGIARDREVWFKRAAASPKGRAVDPSQGGARKADIGSRRGDWLAETRQRWAEVANAALDRAGHARIDHRSLAEQNVARPPTEHLGPQPAAIEERTGRRSDRRRRLEVRAELREPVARGVTTRTPHGRRAAPLRAVAVPEVPALSRPENVAEKVLAASLAAIQKRNQERRHELEQRRDAAAREIGRAGRQLEAGDRLLRGAGQQLGRAERPALRTDLGAEHRERALEQMGRDGQSAGEGVPRRGDRIREALGGLGEAARRRAQVVAPPAPRPVPSASVPQRPLGGNVQGHLPPITGRPDLAAFRAARAQPEPEPAAPTLAERIAASLATMLEWVKSLKGEVREVKPGQLCVGTIQHADEHHAVQSAGRGWYHIHRQADLPARLQVGKDVVTIKYGRDGRVTVETKGIGQGLGAGRC